MRLVSLSEISEVSSGQAAPKKKEDFSNEGIPFIRAGSLEDLISGAKKENDLELVDDSTITKYKLKVYQPKTIVFAKSGMSATKDRIYQLKGRCCIVSHLAILVTNNKVDSNFLVYALRKRPASILINDLAYPSLSKRQIDAHKVPFFNSLTDQIRIATLLSRVEQLIQKRKASIDWLDELVKSRFLEMFGDPFINTKDWEKRSIRSVSEKFSDGPFGSNLKTIHYREEGVRVIRLQNIGRGVFLDEYKNYVSNEHYLDKLKKHTCLPGDVIIGTMGTPNIRSCILPNTIEFAINKADCIQCRPNNDFVIAEYLNGLFNLDNAENLVRKILHGQTRVRVSMGQLARIEIPIPPIELQKQFAKASKKAKQIKSKYETSLLELENLYGSLSQRAFRGELDLSGMEVEVTEEEVKEVMVETIKEVEVIKEIPKNKLRGEDKLDEFKNLSFKEVLLSGKSVPLNWENWGNKKKVDLDAEPELYKYILHYVFKKNPFTFSEIEMRVGTMMMLISNADTFYKEEKWKSVIFDLLQNEPHNLTQEFEEETGTIKLRFTNEAFKA